MRNIDRRFLEEYIKTDETVQEILHLEKGISDYLDLMKQNQEDGKKSVSSWQMEYQKLQSLRHKRNRLAHESDAENAEKEDLEYLKDLRKSLKKGNDALQLYLNRYKRSKMKFRKEKRLPMGTLVFLIMALIIATTFVLYFFLKQKIS